ncbi:Beta-xylosidase [Acinetobacter baumannii]|nr:Beta-xylosidase [Acinetobacter baumannii]
MNIAWRSALTFLFVTSSLLSTQVNGFEVGIGMHVRTYPNDPGYYLDKIKSAGFTSFREDYPWQLVELQKGTYSNNSYLQKVDTAFSDGEKYGLSSVLILDYSNKNYDSYGYPNTDAAIEGFANYAYWTARRFSGKVKYFEIWNEWLYKTGIQVRGAVPPPPEVYAKLVIATAKAVKKANPDAIIITGSFSPFSTRDVAWFDKVIDAGVLNYIDGISLHELGFPTYSGKDGLRADKVAQYVMKYTLLAQTRSYIKGVWWYDLIDDGTSANNKEHNFGFFTRMESPKESVSAIEKITQLTRNYSIQDIKKSSDGTNIVTLKNKGENKFATIYWKEDKPAKNKSGIQKLMQSFSAKDNSDKVNFLNAPSVNSTTPKASSTPTIIYSDNDPAVIN